MLCWAAALLLLQGRRLQADAESGAVRTRTGIMMVQLPLFPVQYESAARG
jgi:hypothetical protein